MIFVGKNSFWLTSSYLYLAEILMEIKIDWYDEGKGKGRKNLSALY